MQIEAQAILFDNDGVLVDSHEQVVAAWSQLAAEYSLDIDRLLVELVGVRSADTLSRYVPAEQLDDAVARLEVLEIELAAQTPALVGALDLVSQLPPDRWAIVTSATRPLADARWAGAQLVPPPSTVTADDVSHGKPHPEPFLAGAKVLGFDAARCVVFEDSPSGGEAARAAGAAVVAVGSLPWSFEPTARVNDLSEVTVHATADGLMLTIDN